MPDTDKIKLTKAEWDRILEEMKQVREMINSDTYKINTEYPNRTICEVLREIYDLTCVYPNGNPYKTRLSIRIKLREALTMAKKMND